MDRVRPLTLKTADITLQDVTLNFQAGDLLAYVCVITVMD
jgi:hypothetical protein